MEINDYVGNIITGIHDRVWIYTEIHDQMRITTQVLLTKCEYQQWQMWTSEDINIGYMNMYDYQHWDTWPSVSINKAIHENMGKLKCGHMTKCEYQQWDAWLSMDIHTLIYDQVRRTSVVINMKICDWVWRSTQVYISKCDYSQRITWPSENSNMAKFEYQFGDTYRNMGIQSNYKY